MTNLPTNNEEKNTPEDVAQQRIASAEALAPQQNMAGEEEVLIRKRKRNNKKKKKRLRIVAIVVIVLVLIGAGIAWAVSSAVNAGKNSLQTINEGTQVDTGAGAVSYDEGKTVVYNGHTYQLNENMVSVAAIGFDKNAPAVEGEPSGQADTIMVFAFDTQKGEATAIVIPRDSMVEVGEYVGSAFLGEQAMQICLAYSYGDGAETSCEYTSRIASRVLYNMPLDHYFALDLSGVAPLNDAIGGVALTPLQSIPGTNITEGQSTVLFGDNALRYVRWRDTALLDSALGRQERQVQYVKAFAQQSLSMAGGNVATLLDLYGIASEHAVTNLGVEEFGYLASSVLANGMNDFEIISLPGEMVEGEKYAEFYLDKDAVYETVLSVYYDQVD